MTPGYIQTHVFSKKDNSLWHIDGHHSLIRWHVVVHGGIDGFSRMITYL